MKLNDNINLFVHTRARDYTKKAHESTLCLASRYASEAKTKNIKIKKQRAKERISLYISLSIYISDNIEKDALLSQSVAATWRWEHAATGLLATLLAAHSWQLIIFRSHKSLLA